MIGAISPYSGGAGFDFAAYAASRSRAATPREIDQVTAARQAADPAAPVRPADRVGELAARSPGRAAGSAGGQTFPLVREGVDPVEMAVRMRIQYLDDAGAQEAAALPGPEAEEAAPVLPGQEEAAGQPTVDSELKSAREVMEEEECQTCAERRYQDGSDDPGVSFKTPTHIEPELSASAVRSHEMEHVYRNQAAAEREGREVVSQSVTYSNAICPECGTVYVSGGVTRTTTAAANEPQQAAQQQQQDELKRGPFAAVA